MKQHQSVLPLSRRFMVLGACVASMLVAVPASAETLMGKSPWSFTQTTSRASIAALQMQQEGLSSGGGSSSGSGAVYACGGGGTATATANYTCIILNNSNSSINTGQASTGDQGADSQTNTTANGQSLSSVLESLQ